MQRTSRSSIAQETVAIVERGTYAAPAGHTVNIAGPVEACLAATRYLVPEELGRLGQRGAPRSPEGRPCRIELTNESTLTAIARALIEGAETVSALNFASARNTAAAS